MIKSYLESIEGIDSILYDKNMLTEVVDVYTEIPGQYFCATYNYEDKKFTRFSIQSGKYKTTDAIRHFRTSCQPEFLERILKDNKKKKFFRGSGIFRFFFKYSGMNLELTDVWSDGFGYIGTHDWNTLFVSAGYIESSKYIGPRKLTLGFLKSHPGCLVRIKDGRKIRI